MNDIDILLKSLFFFLIFSYSLVYAQRDTLDTVELKSNKVYQGKVMKVKTSTIEFKDAVTNLSYEFEKTDIKFVRLADGTTLTFNEKAQSIGNENSEHAQSSPAQPETPPAKADKEENPSLSKTIIIAAGVVVGVLLLAVIIF